MLVICLSAFLVAVLLVCGAFFWQETAGQAGFFLCSDLRELERLHSLSGDAGEVTKAGVLTSQVLRARVVILIRWQVARLSTSGEDVVSLCLDLCQFNLLECCV